MIKFKENVRVKNLTPALMEILTKLFILNEELIPSFPGDWFITSINDSVHLVNSRHYKDEAIDVRSKNFSLKNDKLLWVSRMGGLLGNKFTILLEAVGTPNEHFHIQVKKGMKFP